MRDSQVSVTRGRQLAYTDVGEPDWPCVFFFHGAPMSRLHLAYLEQKFLAEGIRVVSPDRPAYGGSSPQPSRSMADWPPDVATLADALGIDRFVVAGVTDMGWPGAWEGYVDSERQLMRLPDEEAAIGA